MSYILEALKKVEQKQQREGAPRLLTIPTEVGEERKKRRVLPYIIAAALLLNAAVMTAWWMTPRFQYNEQQAATLNDSVKEPETFRTPPPLDVDEARSETRLTEQAIPNRSSDVALHESRMTARIVPRSVPVQAAKAIPSGQQSVEGGVSNETGNIVPPPRAKLLSLGELPLSIRGGLPEFKISGHAYSPEPRFRVARVNNKIVQEGEALSQGLKVDEIVPGGIIFTFQGYRFRVGLNDNP
jgi:general secretion pathway protein B